MLVNQLRYIPSLPFSLRQTLREIPWSFERAEFLLIGVTLHVVVVYSTFDPTALGVVFLGATIGHSKFTPFPLDSQAYYSSLAPHIMSKWQECRDNLFSSRVS
jgi:hypothetical protein